MCSVSNNISSISKTDGAPLFYPRSLLYIKTKRIRSKLQSLHPVMNNKKLDGASKKSPCSNPKVDQVLLEVFLGSKSSYGV